MRAYTGVRKCPFHNLALASIRNDKKSSAALHPSRNQSFGPITKNPDALLI